MLRSLRFASPAMAVAVVALFFALSGTAVAAQPGPALVSVRTAPFSFNPEQGQAVSVSCESGKKAIGGGYTSPSLVLSADTQVNGATFQIYLMNVSSQNAASGTAHAVGIGRQADGRLRARAGRPGARALGTYQLALASSRAMARASASESRRVSKSTPRTLSRKPMR